jgi:hypothetical protein
MRAVLIGPPKGGFYVRSDNERLRGRDCSATRVARSRPSRRRERQQTQDRSGLNQRADETFSENRQASRQSARPVSAPRTRIIRPSRLRGGTPAVRPPLLRSPASKPHGSLMKQLRRAVGADPSLKRQAKPDRRSASRRARAIPFVPKKTVEQQDIRALHRARQRGGREGTLFVRNNPAIRGLVGWRAYMCAPARARRTYASRPPGHGAFLPVGVSVF